MAKKKLAGAEHPSASCVSCKNQSVDYKNLQKEDSPGMGCCLKEFDNDLKIFKNYFDKLLMFNMDVRRSMETQTITRSNYNLPFEFGEITGKYIDYFDKLLAYLQSLACHLLHRYPQTKELKEVSFMLLNYRAIHWAASCQTKDFEEREAITLKYVANIYGDHILELHETLGTLESQQDGDGVTYWNTFLFLYEMLGVSTLVFPLFEKDVQTFEYKDILRVAKHMTLKKTIKDRKYKIVVSPQYAQAIQLQEHIHSLEICDENFNLKPFREINEHFINVSAAHDTHTYYKDIKHLEPLLCELCSKQIDLTKCQYVFNSTYFFDGALSGLMNRDKMPWDVQRRACASWIVEDKAYITYSIGSGMKAICNKGHCKNIFVDHVALYRVESLHSITTTIAKYGIKFKDLRCWGCRRLSGSCHRCSTCKSRLYCSKECQDKDWKIHKTICQDLKEDGKQIKIESHQHKVQGKNAALETLEGIRKKTKEQGCNCKYSNCDAVDHVHKLSLKETESEVD